MSEAAAAPTADSGPLAIICGGGTLPFAVADAVAQARAACGAVRACAAGPIRSAYCRLPASLGRIRPDRPVLSPRPPRGLPRRGVHRHGRAAGHLADQASISRHSALLPRILGLFRGGDDHLLKGVARIVRGARLPPGRRARGGAGNPDAGRRRSGSVQPSDRDQADIAQGACAARRHRPVRRRPGGGGRRRARAGGRGGGRHRPDARACRGAAPQRAHRATRAGVLVKAPKRGQDRRFDLPSIGPRTVEGAAQAGLAGIAVVAGQHDRRRAASASRATADARSLFVVGVRDETAER